MVIVRRRLEMLIEKNNGRIIRYCSNCDNKTLWKIEKQQRQLNAKPVEIIRCAICRSSIERIIEKPEL